MFSGTRRFPFSSPSPEDTTGTALAAHAETPSSALTFGRVCVIYAAFALFFLELTLSVTGKGDRIRFAGLQPQDLALGLLLAFEGVNSETFRRRLQTLPSLLFAGALLLYTVVGVAQGNSSGWIRTDLRFFLWIHGGLAFFHAFWRTRRPALHLVILQVFLAILLFLAARQAASAHFSEANFESGKDRLYGLNLFAVGSAQLFFLALHYSLFATRRRALLGWALGFSLLFVYFVLYLSATRNLLISYAALLLGTAPAFLYRYEPLKQGFGRRIRLERVALLGLLAVVVAGFAFAEANDLLILRRFEGGDLMKDASARGRVVELQRAVHHLDPQDYITGTGLGKTFRPNYLYESNFLHLGIAGLVIKLGLPVGLLVVLLLYGFVPLSLLWAALLPGSLSSHTRSATYCAVPLSFPWLVQLGISGGFDPIHALGAGLALGVFADVSAHGMRPLFHLRAEENDSPAAIDPVASGSGSSSNILFI